MIRKLLLVAAATAMPLGFIAATAGVAGAKAKPPTAATDTISCTGLTGTASFSTPLNNTGFTKGTETTTVSGTLSGCTVGGGFAESVSSATISGSFKSKASVASPGGKCTGLAGPSAEKGSLSITWSASPAAPATTEKVTGVTGGAASDSHASFSISGTSKGSFSGADKGKSDSSNAETTQTLSTILTECSGAGVSSLGLQSPASGAAVTLG